MKFNFTVVFAAVLLFASSLTAQEPSWTKQRSEQDKRDKLHDATQHVRGDTGKWSDQPRLQHAPPIERKPTKASLDDWSEQLLEKTSQLNRGEDSWLLFQTAQLNDNDRVWIERIERQGDEFTLIVNLAKWQGRYRKNFTYFQMLGVNLGKLEPGEYQVKCIIQPLEFTRFGGDGRPRGNWSKNERPADKKPIELRIEFGVAADSATR